MSRRSDGAQQVVSFELLAPMLQEVERARQEYVPLRQLPTRMRDADLLRVALSDGMVSMVITVRVGIASTSGTLGEFQSWSHYLSGQLGKSLQEVLERDPQVDIKDGLHIRLTREGRDALARWRLFQKSALPENLIALPQAAERYHVTKKALREAVGDGRLADHRPSQAAKNAVILLNEHEVAARWSLRE